MPWAPAHRGKWDQLTPPQKKWMKIKKNENMQKAVFYVYVMFREQSGHIYSDILQNAPFRSQIFKIFFASGGKGALTPLTKILRTFLRDAAVK